MTKNDNEHEAPAVIGPGTIRPLPPVAGAPRINFVDARADDLDDLVSLRIEAMRESLERIGRFDATRARQRFAGSFAPEHTRHVEVDGERVGFVVVRPDGDGLLLDHLYIRPAMQRRGIGAQVLSQVFAQADAIGATVRVGALKGSDSNRFYARHGFRLVEQGEFDNHHERPAAARR